MKLTAMRLINDDELEQVSGGLDKIGVGHPNL